MKSNKILFLLMGLLFIVSQFLIEHKTNFVAQIILSVAIFTLSIIMATSKNSKLSRGGLLLMIGIGALFIIVPYLFK